MVDTMYEYSRFFRKVSGILHVEPNALGFVTSSVFVYETVFTISADTHNTI